MATFYQREHNRRVDRDPEAMRGHLAAHAELFRTWLPADVTTAASVPNTYLAELYPHIWRFGPRGDIYMAQLAAIETELDAIADGSDDLTLVNDANDLLHGLNSILHDENLFSILSSHANAYGLPLPGDDIMYGMDVSPLPVGESPRIDYITRHIVWTEYLDDGIVFEDFLYCFGLLSLHGAFLATLVPHYPALEPILTEYTELCTHWGYPL